MAQPKRSMDPRLLRRVRRWDRIATGVITAGGLFVIVAVLGILVLTAKVALPLFQAPDFIERYVYSGARPSGSDRPLALGLDEYLDSIYLLDGQGLVTFLKAEDGSLLEEMAIDPPTPGATRVVQAWPYGREQFSLLWADGALSLVRVVVRPVFDDQGRRTLAREVAVEAHVPPSAEGGMPERSIARWDEEVGLTRVDVMPDGRVVVSRRLEAENLLGEVEVQQSSTVLQSPVSGKITHLLLDATGSVLVAGTDSGYLLRWDLTDLEEAELTDRVPATSEGRAVTALRWLQGEYTVALGDEGGRVSGWFPVSGSDDEAPRLTRVHHLIPSSAPIVMLLPSLRGKSMVRFDAGGGIAMDHFTTGRNLLRRSVDAPPVLAALSSRADGLASLDAQGKIRVWHLDLPHPEVSLGAYFGKVWYESYPGPAHVWQSSAGTDDFEPKLGLVPLVFGTLKATFFGMMFAAPLAILGALYTSSLMNPTLRRFIKPAFEIMGAVPTVVIGFLAALWLAPLLNASLTGFLLTLGFIPLAVIVVMVLIDQVRGLVVWQRKMRGNEFLLAIPLVLLAVYVAFLAGRGVDVWLFGGGMPIWISETLGLHFDQRNSLVIAAALGFAVLPIIFTISDDALSNVPRHLTAASLALGASRWQTVWRVVLPSASAGIFAAMMIGLGRAVGETMIVLMATGNTPIMDLSPFNGMRTLSANIAVEIPEAPLDGTLYRTLFLSAVILFMTTFVLNSVAEVVRQRLRRKFGQY